MKVGERGQVTIPKDLRQKFGIGPDTEVEFHTVKGGILLKKTPQKLKLRKWKGRAKASFKALGFNSVDHYIERVRGR